MSPDAPAVNGGLCAKSSLDCQLAKNRHFTNYYPQTDLPGPVDVISLCHQLRLTGPRSNNRRDSLQW